MRGSGGRVRGPRCDAGAAALCALAIVIGLVLLASSAAHARECKRADFEAVVDEAGAALRKLNSENRPALQEKLRALRDKRGWSNDQFIAEAAPFVRDEKTEDYDRQSNDFLEKITQMGQPSGGADAANARAPDCGVLAELKGHMASLVAVQQAKWTHIFGKLAAELAR
jgi:hypothetical protein